MELVPWVSLIQDTVNRHIEVIWDKNDIYIGTNQQYKYHVLNHLKKYWIDKVIVEPDKRNTAPAIALIAKYLTDIEKINENEVVLFSPSDHIITPVSRFKKYIKQAENAVKDWKVVIFWIRPHKPETGYGYINVSQNKNTKTGICDVKQMVEKPDIETAKKYLLDWSYYWNAGILMLTIKTLKNEFKNHCKELFDSMKKPYDAFFESFKNLKSISIDYAILEKTNNLVCMPMDINWSDVWSWDSIYDIDKKDKNWNIVKWNVVLNNVKNSLVWSADNRLIALEWMENIIMIDTHDALLLAKRDEWQQIKDIVKKLDSLWKNEIKEHITTHKSRWTYTVLENWKWYKTKRVTMNPWEKLSRHKHYHRSEHWIVVKWTALVWLWDETKSLNENESIFIPKTVVHRLENPGKVALEIIEVQVWKYLDEDDIETVVNG